MTRPVTLEIDGSVGAAYITLSNEAVARTVEVTPDVMVDLDKMDVVVGIEILSLNADIPIGPLSRDYHIHSSVVETLKRIRPSVSSFVVSTSSSGGHADAVSPQVNSGGPRIECY